MPAPITNLFYDELNDEYFLQIADILLNHCCLTVNKTKYRLMEIEFYLKCEAHPDPYTHCDPDQLLMHTFYFHKFKTGTYKAGTFKGMDITFGDHNANAYFGILIRTIENITTGEVIEGPCNVVNRILTEYEEPDLISFTNGQILNIFENDKNFILGISKNLNKREIFYGPRIGLSSKFMEYHKKLYRFVSNKDKIKKKKTTLVKAE